jgi:ABC-2 type transport system permease protein
MSTTRFSVTRLLQMIRKEMKQLVRDPKSRPLVFVAPFVQFTLLAYAVTTDVEHMRTIVVDQDHSIESRALVQAYATTDYFDVVEYADRVERVAQALDRSEIVVGIVIPSGFARDMKSQKGASVQALIDGSDASVANVAQGYVGQVTSSFGASVAGEVRQRPGVELRTRAWFNPSLTSRWFNIPAIMGVLLLMTCLILTALSVVREREIGTLDQLLVSPLTAPELMIAKMVPIFGVGLIHLSIFVSLALLHFKVPLVGTAAALALAAILYILAALAIGLLISSLSRTQQEAFMLLILVMLPAIIISGFLSPIEGMPTAFQWAAAVNPIAHFLDIMRGVFLKGTGLAELWPKYLSLAVVTAGALWLATNRFKASIA